MSIIALSNSNLVSNFCSYLAIRDVIAFESAGKLLVTRTSAAWKYFQNQRRQNAAFSCCEKEENKYKWNYIVSVSVERYLIYHRRRYPFLRKKFQLYNKLAGRRLKERDLDLRFSGDILIRGFVLRNPYELNKAIELGATMTARIAIKFFEEVPDLQDLVCNLSIQAAHSKLKDFQPIDQLTVDWAKDDLKDLLNKTKNIALPTILFHYAQELDKSDREPIFDKVLEEFGDLGITVPTPILEAIVRFKFNERQDEETEFYCEQLVKRNDASLESILALADTKKLLKKYEEAEQLFEKAYLRDTGKRYPYILPHLAICKYHLDKIDEAEKIFDQSFKQKGFEPSEEILVVAGGVKYILTKWDEAEFYNDWALRTTDNPDANFLYEIAVVKLKLGKKEEVDLFLDRALKKRDDLAPIDIAKIAYLKETEFNQINFAESLYEQVLIQSKNEPHYYVILFAAENKFHLNKFEQAEILFDLLLSTFDHRVSPDVLLEIALLKLSLKKEGKEQEAFTLIEKALTDLEVYEFPKSILESSTDHLKNIIDKLKTISESVPHHILTQASALHLLHGSHRLALLYYEEARSQDSHSTFEELYRITKVNMSQGDYQAAEELFHKMLYKFEEELTSEHLIDAAVVKLNLKKYPNSEKLVEMALDKFKAESSPLVLEKKESLLDRIAECYEELGIHIPINVIKHIAFVKYKIGKHKEAEKFLEMGLDHFEKRRLAADGDFLNLVALNNIALGEVEQAEYYFCQTLVHFPFSRSSSDIKTLLAWGIAAIETYKMKKYKEAESMFSLVLGNKFLVSPKFLAFAALNYLKLNEKRKARKLFKSLKSEYPDYIEKIPKEELAILFKKKRKKRHKKHAKKTEA